MRVVALQERLYQLLRCLGLLGGTSMGPLTDLVPERLLAELALVGHHSRVDARVDKERDSLPETLACGRVRNTKRLDME